ncbi:minor tail protein [Mycobacterium phage Marcoliusprime]|uniref:minor tail protein n=1 Tax=Mycobacterium phage Milly TaxID=1567473 RepID=UPI000572A86B|nr:minor tail protein [Mycobacterium phage Milly]AJA43694.1 minor tail protein [Mycobacterium phage Milly]AOZ64360.1 minor tail protein [Mycobacterium phage Marcoliusprime]ASR86565.1 minor tail protein [Mycobacterium phage DismalFunk]AYB68976.1 minor tail protein [Mycobacterium phage DismalStressor]
MAEIPATGDAVRLFQTLLSATWYGIVRSKDDPGGMAATMEMIDDEAVITTDVLIGPKGDKGDNAPLVDLQWPPLEQAADLEPLKSTLLPKDKGKAWWIGTLVYVWTGEKFEAVRPGPAGPPGATPHITVSAETIPMSERNAESKDEVIPSGTSLNPHLHFRLLSPQGPRGPSTNILDAPDYDNTKAPEDGQTPVWSSVKQKWVPSSFAHKHPRLYSVPEAAFQNFTGVAQRHPILTYVVEAQDYAWTPYVLGHLKAFGVELDQDPLTIGCEVRLGDPTTGDLVARGFGNIASWAHIVPHYSTSSDPATAVAPGNGVAVVPAGQTAQISVSLYNDGLLGAYIFNRRGAQLSILTIPTGDE